MSERTVQRGDQELLDGGAMCLIGYPNGGRHCTRRYHLHGPNEVCVHCGQTGQQKAPETRTICHPFAPLETKTKTTENQDTISQNQDKIDSAYKEEHSLETFPKKHSLSSSPSGRLRRTNDDDGDAPPLNSSEKLTPEDHEVFERIGNLIARDIPGDAKHDIRNQLRRQGYSLEQFEFLVRQDQRRYRGPKLESPVGLLRSQVKRVDLLVDGVQFPNCFKCSDTGKAEVEDSPFGGEGPCTCESGVSKAKSNFPHWEAYQAAKDAGEPFCLRCGNTGYERGDDLECSVKSCHVVRAKRELEAQRKREEVRKWQQFMEEEERKEREEEERRREKAKQDGLCPECFGAGKQTLLYWGTPREGECAECLGLGKPYTGPTGDLKFDLRMALHLARMYVSADEVNQSEVILKGNELIVHTQRSYSLALRDSCVQQIASQVVGKPIRMRITDKVDADF